MACSSSLVSTLARSDRPGSSPRELGHPPLSARLTRSLRRRRRQSNHAVFRRIVRAVRSDSLHCSGMHNELGLVRSDCASARRPRSSSSQPVTGPARKRLSESARSRAWRQKLPHDQDPGRAPNTGSGHHRSQGGRSVDACSCSPSVRVVPDPKRWVIPRSMNSNASDMAFQDISVPSILFLPERSSRSRSTTQSPCAATGSTCP